MKLGGHFEAFQAGWPGLAGVSRMLFVWELRKGVESKKPAFWSHVTTFCRIVNHCRLLRFLFPAGGKEKHRSSQVPILLMCVCASLRVCVFPSPGFLSVAPLTGIFPFIRSVHVVLGSWSRASASPFRFLRTRPQQSRSGERKNQTSARHLAWT